MAVTRTADVVRLGAPGDQEVFEGPLTNAKVKGFLVTVGTTPGVVIINEGATGAGQPIFEAYMKSNSSLVMQIPCGIWTAGGFKSHASNPAGTVALVYMGGN